MPANERSRHVRTSAYLSCPVIPLDHFAGKYQLDPKTLASTLLKKGDKVILYRFCVVEMQTEQAARILDNQGYVIRSLKSGYEELIEAGFRNEDSR
jgi:hypothetical protein